MFFEYYKQLCDQKGVSPSRAAEDIGLSRTSVVKWKNGSVPSGATLKKIGEYFGVSADALLREGAEAAPEPDVTFDDFTYALHNETKELTEENRQKLLELARFFRQEQEKKGR